jgi:hypothetical protein
MRSAGHIFWLVDFIITILGDFAGLHADDFLETLV